MILKLFIEKMHVNIGLDTTLGKDDWGIYFRIGKSFGASKSKYL